MISRIAVGSLTCLALLASAASGHTNHHKGHASTSVHLEAFVPDAPQHGGFFSGTVTSTMKCSNTRKLEVMFRKHGPDKLVGTGQSDADGAQTESYNIFGRTNKSGHYYVMATETKKCAAASSNSLTVATG